MFLILRRNIILLADYYNVTQFFDNVGMAYFLGHSVDV